MKVLVISSNRVKALAAPIPAFPSGPAYIAGAAREAGHEVEVFDACLADDVTGELTEHVERFDPDAIGISVRNVRARRWSDHQDLRPGVKEITDSVTRISTAPVVLGGPAINNFGREWLEYLDLDFALRGEGELTFPRYLDMLDGGGDIHTIQGGVYREDGQLFEVPIEPVEDLDATPYPAFELFDLDAYRTMGCSPSIFTKRGCSFHCTHCPQDVLEGSRYRLKSPKRVIDEIDRARSAGNADMFYLSDNLFNFPRHHAEAILDELIEKEPGIRWTADGLTPLGMTKDFCRLLKESGCAAASLSVESGSERMLKRMRRGYSTEHIREAITSLSRAELPFMVSLLLGGPGESPETIDESMDLLGSLPQAQIVNVNIGLSLEHHQGVLADARRDGQLQDESGLFDGSYYLSPELSEDYLEDLVESLEGKANWFVV